MYTRISGIPRPVGGDELRQMMGKRTFTLADPGGRVLAMGRLIQNATIETAFRIGNWAFHQAELAQNGSPAAPILVVHIPRTFEVEMWVRGCLVGTRHVTATSANRAIDKAIPLFEKVVGTACYNAKEIGDEKSVNK